MPNNKTLSQNSASPEAEPKLYKGSIIFSRQNTRSPYIARRYKGRNENGNPAYYYLGSFKTRAEAEVALIDARCSTIEELKNQNMTVQELFNSMIANFEKAKISKETISGYMTAIRKCEEFLDRPYSSITWKEMNDKVLSAPTIGTKRALKTLFKKLDIEAERLDLPGKRYADYITRIVPDSDDAQIPRVPLSNEEVQNLLKHPDEKDIYIPLVSLYTGLRPIEFRTLSKQNVDLNEMTIRGGAKTEAGYNRTIPLHPYIQSYIIDSMNTPGEYLFPNERGGLMSCSEFSLRFKMAVQPYIKPGHIPYEMRHSFCTRLDEEEVRYNVINSLMGHKQYNAGAQVYAHVSIDRLRDGIMHLWERQ